MRRKTYCISTASVLAILSVSAAHAQTAGTAVDEEIVVTGSNIRGVAPTGAPLITIGSDDILKSGKASVSEYLRDLPQNFQGGVESDQLSVGASRIGNNGANVSAGQGLNLRGLGPLSTLTLVNGRRMPGSGQYAEFVDISNIPLAVIERVEVVTDGASAIYGSDAVGGVVNFILKKRFTDPVTTLRYGEATQGGGRLTQFSQTLGTDWDTGDISFAYEFSKQTRIEAKDRDFTNGANFEPFGGINWRRLNNRFGAQANITGTASGATANTTYIIPPNQNGVGLTAADLLPGASNPYSTYDPYNQVDLSPEQERHSAYIAWNQDVGEVSLHADLRFTRRRGHSQNGYGTLGTQGVSVRDSNPYFITNPTNLPGLYATRAYRPGLPVENLINAVSAVACESACTGFLAPVRPCRWAGEGDSVKAGGSDGMDALDRWFMAEVLPHEPMLMRYLRRNCGKLVEPEDLRQDIYAQVYDAARISRPVHVAAFLWTVARNLLVSHARRAKIVRIEEVEEIDDFGVDTVTPERNALARAELRRVEEGLNNLPPRCREVIVLRKIRGLSQKQVAREMNIGLDTVERQTALGMRALVDFMMGGEGKVQRPPARLRLVNQGSGDEPA